MTALFRAAGFVIVTLGSSTSALAQFPQPRVLAGVQVSVLDERNAIAAKRAGSGGRITYFPLNRIAIEAEANRFPLPGAVSLYPATQLLFGARVGHRWGPVGLYGKLRPGFTRFDSSSLGSKPALDFGAVVEAYTEQHLALRFDVGNTVVFYGNSMLGRQGQPMVSGAKHQMQVSVGISVWF